MYCFTNLYTEIRNQIFQGLILNFCQSYLTVGFDFVMSCKQPFNLLALLHYYLLHAQANKSMSQHAMFLSGLT